MSPEEEKVMLDRLKGWHKILDDKCNRNDIIDILTLNQPTCISQRSQPPINSLYSFAAFLPPGLHSFLIYDPYTSRAFCKTMVVDHNKQYFFSDLPASVFNKKSMSQDEVEQRKHTLRQFWRKFKSTQEDWMTMVYFNDRNSYLLNKVHDKSL